MTIPKISVVIPCYNHARFLKSAVNSILNQVLPVFEIIVIDDGSTDDTESLMKTLGEQKLQYFRQPNGGPSKARNKGLEIASGEFIGFLDADDYWHPQFTLKMIDALNKNPASIVVGCDINFVDENSILIASGLSATETFTIKKLLYKNAFSVSASFYRTSLLKEAGGFDESLIGVEDWEILLRLCSHGSLILKVAEILVDYRIVQNSLSKKISLMEQNALLMLDNFFSNSKLPPEIIALREYMHAMRILDAAVGYFRIGEEIIGEDEFIKAVNVFPPILGDIHTYFSVVSATQPFPFLGSGEFLDLNEGENRAKKCMNLVHRDYPEWRQKAKASLCIVLGRLAYSQDNMVLARKYWNQAFCIHPINATGLGWPLNVIKTFIGRKNIEKIKRRRFIRFKELKKKAKIGKILT
jgi:glycosyltransferase involved in cell wall biosynthesis